MRVLTALIGLVAGMLFASAETSEGAAVAPQAGQAVVDVEA